MFVIGSRDTQRKLDAPIKSLLGELDPVAFSPASHASGKLIQQRLSERLPDATAPVFVGLMNPNAQGGVIMNSAPLVTYSYTNREALLETNVRNVDLNLKLET